MYYQPTTVEGALKIKAAHQASARFVAGGTDFVVGLRKGRERPEHLIDLSRIEALREVGEEGAWLRVGAGVTHAALESSALTALAVATASVGGPQIRNLGTVGGQIGTASPAGDVSVALLALKAEIELVSLARGRRRLPLSEMFLRYATTALADDEMIAAVYVPTNRKSAFHKIGKRRSVAISVAVVAVSVGLDGDVGIGLGCVGPTPLRCFPAETYLAEHERDDVAIEKAGELVEAYVEPIDDHRGSADYRRAMAGRLTKRLLRELLER